MPPGQACPRCRFAVEAHSPSDAHPKPKAVEPLTEHQQEELAEVFNEACESGHPVLTDAALARVVEISREQAVTKLYQRYDAFSNKLARLLAEKQTAYGDSFRYTRKVLAILYPNGVSVEQYRDLLTITRIIDKLFRVANQKNAFGESPWQDIAGYAIRAACEDEDQGVASTPDKSEEPIGL